MLRILFQIGEHRFALDSRAIDEIVPAAHFRPIPGAPDYVRGVFLFRGRVVPVIDLSSLAGSAPARSLMSTRVILVEVPDRRGKPRLLGLLAEKVTDTLNQDALETQPAGVTLPASGWLGDMIAADNRLVQEIEVDRLLPDSARALLFQDEGTAPA